MQVKQGLCLAALFFLVTIADAKAPQNLSYFALVGTGVSFSRQEDISANPVDWDASPQGYNNSLNNSVLYTAGFGAQFTPLISLDVETTLRPSFSYKKYQTSTASGTPNFLGNKTRYFNLSDTSLMLNAYFHGQGLSDRLNYNLSQNTTLQPVIGLGVGVAYNTVSNFYSVVTSNSSISSVISNNSTYSLAWQTSLALEITHLQKFGIDVGYRYFDGGIFRSGNFIISPPTDQVSPWEGRLHANEAFVDLTYHLS